MIFSSLGGLERLARLVGADEIVSKATLAVGIKLWVRVGGCSTDVVINARDLYGSGSGSAILDILRRATQELSMVAPELESDSLDDAVRSAVEGTAMLPSRFAAVAQEMDS